MQSFFAPLFSEEKQSRFYQEPKAYRTILGKTEHKVRKVAYRKIAKWLNASRLLQSGLPKLAGVLRSENWELEIFANPIAN